ncbi:molecular chaperone [Pseudomonadota bacterium]
MTKRAALWFVILSIGLIALSPRMSLAQGAGDLIVTPTRIVFEDRMRSAQVTLSNRGSATATFRISLIDMQMDENGEMREAQPGDAGSAVNLVRHSPRQINIAPGAHQVVRLALRKPASLAEGEYRSHMFFRAVPPETAGRSVTDETALEKNELRIQLIPIYGVTIPVIVRHGALSVNAGIAKAVHLPASGELPRRLQIALTRGGDRSAFGDLVAAYQAPGGGEEIIVGRISRLAVYTPNEKRNVVMTLQVPDGVTLKPGGSLRVTYRATENEGGQVLAEQSIRLK